MNCMGVMGVPILFMQMFSIADMLNQWEAYGVFDLVLPFLLIYSVVFGILTATNILGGNKGINLIISLVLALMALRLGFVSAFFTELFPRFAMGLAILVVVAILMGLFIPKEHIKGWYIFFAIVGILIALIAVVQTFSSLNYFNSYFWQEYASTIITAVLVISVIIGVMIQARPDRGEVTGITIPISPHR